MFRSDWIKVYTEYDMECSKYSVNTLKDLVVKYICKEDGSFYSKKDFAGMDVAQLRGIWLQDKPLNFGKPKYELTDYAAITQIAAYILVDDKGIRSAGETEEIAMRNACDTTLVYDPEQRMLRHSFYYEVKELVKDELYHIFQATEDLYQSIMEGKEYDWKITDDVAHIASIIDYPQQDLDRTVWNKKDNTLNTDLEKVILDVLHGYISALGAIETVIEQIVIVGSIGSYQWKEDSDIDVHIVVNSLTDEVYNDLNLNRSCISGWLWNEHPVNYYFVKEFTDNEVDNIYDVLTKKWVKFPQKEEYKGEIEETQPEVYQKAQEWAKKFDIELGEIDRDAIEFEELFEDIKIATEDDKKKLQESLEKKEQELNLDIDELVKDFDDVHNERKDVFVTDLEQNGTNALQGKSKNWLPGNLIWKLLERWRYVQIIHELKKVVKDNNITEEEVEEIIKEV